MQFAVSPWGQPSVSSVNKRSLSGEDKYEFSVGFHVLDGTAHGRSTTKWRGCLVAVLGIYDE